MHDSEVQLRRLPRVEGDPRAPAVEDRRAAPQEILRKSYGNPGNLPEILRKSIQQLDFLTGTFYLFFLLLDFGHGM